MKKREENSYPKGKYLFLIIVSFVSIVLFLQFVGLSRVSLSLEILNINTTSSKERQYRTSTKPLTLQQKQLPEDIKIETNTGQLLEKVESNAIHLATVNNAPEKLRITTATPATTATKRAATTKINETAVLSKIILFYTPFFREKPWPYFYPKKDYTKTCGCNFDHCEISYNNNDYSKADIVFFHARDMPSISELRDLKSNSKNGQYWMYFVKENPFNIPPTGPLNRLFELAMTYRYNSDFPFPYGRYVNRSQEDKDDYTLDIAKTKSKQIAWMVSHCGTRRDKLAKYFEQHGLTIAVGGGCADQYENKLHCLTRGCTEEMGKYKFYFAAENNLCNQYITEKYWRNPFSINAVPIVLGGSNYADAQLAIPGSFINALDFKTPKKLVEYIKKLDSDDTLYNSYFNWKRYYKLFHEKESGCSYAMCNLCDHLKKGIRVPKDIIDNTINAGSECGQQEQYFDQWIQSAL